MFLTEIFLPNFLKSQMLLTKGGAPSAPSIRLLICAFQMFLRAMLLSRHILWEYFGLVLFVCLHAPYH